ncbi:PBP1A family penicillin-binding protein [Bacillus sp. 3103sda1]|uniref:PBP1A family penicillin-binding protein n=1 Tax=Bacillus sp. 3103sda1 TaxID=2953808 RepID=UPI00209F67E1|nr:PBP1A family penicillin-binding protein [Bacillus sp. 3103sda1]MCP1123208.1 PBP1A family penicillin-binding protein [Bacillus sp. 3103sda1]
MSENYRSREERKHAKKQKQEQPKKAKPKKKGSFLRKFLITCLIIGIVALVAGVSAFFIIIKDAPKLDKAKLEVPLSTKFYDKDGNFVYEYGAEKRTKVTYDQIPKVVEDAFLATEDSRFYEHHGIDFRRTAKAIFSNLTSDSGTQGGSTITQQVIKNYYLTPEQTIKRKVQEWYLAYKLEQQYSKHEILEMYLNKINLGNRSYGIATAAKNYYGKELKDLTLPEAAMLAGLPQGPSIYDPTKPENVKAATERRDTVLYLMNRHGYITKKEMDDAKKIPVTEGLQPSQEATQMPYQGFLDAAVKEIESQIKDVNIGSDGLSIYTTLDPKAQDYADKMMNTEEIINYPDEKFQGAFVFMDTNSGEVRAIGSGRGENKATFKGHNMAIDSERQVGSTMKPVFDYGPAIEYKQWSTYHQVDDSPYKYSSGQEVRNFDNGHKGPMSMRDALAQSRNVPAVKTAKEVGLGKAQTFAEGLGFTFGADGAQESTAIGSNEASPLTVAGAYASFGDGGVYHKPHFVTKVVYPDGKEVNFTPKGKRVMKDYTAYMTTDMLRSVVDSGTGTKANVSSLDVAGKTGTTNYTSKELSQYGFPASGSPDSWFAGYTPQYTMAVWTGYNKRNEGYVDKNSSAIAQRMFKAMMSEFGTDDSRFEMPSSVERINDELYVKGAKKDNIKKIDVSAPGGLQAAYDQSSNSIQLKWAGSSDKDVSYSVSYKGSDGSSGSPDISGTSATISGVQPGATYTISLVATKGNSSSAPVTATVVVPGDDAKKKAEDDAAKKKAEEDAAKKAEQDKQNQNNGNTAPGGGNTTPGGGNTTPGDGNTTPGGGNTTPGGGNTTPGDGNTTPGDGNTTPGDGNHPNPPAEGGNPNKPTQ